MMGENMSQEWQKHNRRVVECQLCPRLVDWRLEVARVKRKAFRTQEYWGRPVPGFGDSQGKVLVVGLAPGAHGSNRTGRMFTGDASGVFLYSALYRAGFANQGFSVNRCDGLMLNDIYISALCRCVPPANKPTRKEIFNCRPFLQKEIKLMTELKGFVALGRMAFDNLLQIYQENYQLNLEKNEKFRHGAIYKFGDNDPWLVASYHPSQQNTQTGKLNQAMFDTIWDSVGKLLA